jgi:hypothetical protein
MKLNYNRHYNLTILNTISLKRKTTDHEYLKIFETRQIRDEEKLVKLNQLVKDPPFCAWHRQKNNDPL